MVKYEDSGPTDSSDDEYILNADNQKLAFIEKLCLTNISDLGQMCKLKYDANYLSILLYMS